MHRKLIFFDIDGTLITQGAHQYVPESTTKALELLHQAGHICLINTGRVYAALDELIKSIKVDGYVCGCGTNIRLGEQILTSNQFSPVQGERIIHALNDAGMEWMLEGETMICYADQPYATRLGSAIMSLAPKLPGKMRKISPSEYGQAQFSKFIMVVPENQCADSLMQAFDDELAFIDRGGRMYEVVPKHFSKATGMKFMETYFDISHEDTIAVGDSTNDISMLEYAQTSILMGNADPSLYGYADYVTAPIERDGILLAFQHLGLI